MGSLWPSLNSGQRALLPVQKGNQKKQGLDPCYQDETGLGNWGKVAKGTDRSHQQLTQQKRRDIIKCKRRRTARFSKSEEREWGRC